MLQVGSFKLYGILSARDLSLKEAATIARNGLPRKELFNSAIVDPHMGLVIFDIFHAVNSQRPDSFAGFHLQSPRCGYDGEAPKAAARILERYGFGNYNLLYEDLSCGGDRAQLCLTRRMRMVLK